MAVKLTHTHNPLFPRAIIAVAFWAETSLHGDFEASARGVIGALDQFDNDNSNPAGFEGFLSFETAR